MLAEDFVKLFYSEKKELLNQYFHEANNTNVGKKISSLNLTKQQQNEMYEIIDSAITDTMYTILLGIDGEASIGNIQQSYRLFDEDGNQLTNNGEIEQYAYEIFHENK